MVWKIVLGNKQHQKLLLRSLSKLFEEFRDLYRSNTSLTEVSTTVRVRGAVLSSWRHRAGGFQRNLVCLRIVRCDCGFSKRE